MSATERGGFAAGDFSVADYCCVGLRAAAVGGTVSRSAVLDCEAGHGDAVGALDFGDDAVGGDGGCEGDDEGVGEEHGV